MSLFSKLFGQKKEIVYPDVPEGMRGAFIKGIGMH